MEFGLERVAHFRGKKSDTGLLHVVFEGRGRNEDADLELAFRRVCARNTTVKTSEMEPLFVHKQANHCGLQLADLIARPIGVQTLRPGQPNRAYEIIKQLRGECGERQVPDARVGLTHNVGGIGQYTFVNLFRRD